MLTGRPGVGKTTTVLRTVGHLVDHGLEVAGFVTAEVRHHGARVGFDLVVLAPDGRRLARHVLARAVGRHP